MADRDVRGEGPQTSALSGLTVVEIGDEQIDYAGLLLAGLGAAVIKVEPPGGSSTRAIGPFADDNPHPEGSLYFWHYNPGKRSIVLDLDDPEDAHTARQLILGADVVLDSTSRSYLGARGMSLDDLRREAPRLITARISPFGDTGLWADFKASDLIHLALGGPAMNCGYDPLPDGTYDLPPIAPQMWHAFHITGEQVAMMIVAAVLERERSGSGQHLSCAVHEAVSKGTEIDLMSWVMRAAPVSRQTCRHASEHRSVVPTIAHTKDGRWVVNQPQANAGPAIDFANLYGLGAGLEREHAALTSGPANQTGASGRDIPGSGGQTEFGARMQETLQRVVGKFSFENVPWRQGQEVGLWISPLRKPHENMADEHWQLRGSFAPVDHPERGAAYTDVVSKWVSDEMPWITGRRAPLLDEDRAEVLDLVRRPRPSIQVGEPGRTVRADGSKPFALEGIRIFDFSWFLATAGGTRFLASLGAECIKVEWRTSPDSRVGAMAPVGGREARLAATGPLPGVTDPDMGGQFLNKNPGKRGISLNVRDPRGLEIARRLIAMSDVVAEGFSPGVLEKWGLGYASLREIRPDIVYAQQTGMGTHGAYGRFRSVGPIAAAFAGASEMSGLPEPAMPAGWGYSYLDWVGAYSFGLAILAALRHRDQTGRGQWIDASQCETGLFVAGTAYLDWSVNGRAWTRYGNRSPYKAAAPHGIFRCSGDDRWLAIACFTDAEWDGLCRVADQPWWATDPRFDSLAARLENQDALEAAVGAWTTPRDARTTMNALQQAGVPAGVCQTAADRCEEDPQLAHLQWLSEVTGTKIGTWPIAEVPVKLAETPARVAGTLGRGAPCYGEDNEYVYGELLGMSSKAIAELRAEGVI